MKKPPIDINIHSTVSQCFYILSPTNTLSLKMFPHVNQRQVYQRLHLIKRCYGLAGFGKFKLPFILRLLEGSLQNGSLLGCLNVRIINRMLVVSVYSLHLYNGKRLTYALFSLQQLSHCPIHMNSVVVRGRFFSILDHHSGPLVI